jgi:hypothetical protein
LQHDRVLALAQTLEQHDPTAGKFKRVLASEIGVDDRF